MGIRYTCTPFHLALIWSSLCRWWNCLMFVEVEMLITAGTNLYDFHRFPYSGHEYAWFRLMPRLCIPDTSHILGWEWVGGVVVKMLNFHFILCGMAGRWWSWWEVSSWQEIQYSLRRPPEDTLWDISSLQFTPCKWHRQTDCLTWKSPAKYSP